MLSRAAALASWAWLGGRWLSRGPELRESLLPNRAMGLGLAGTAQLSAGARDGMSGRGVAMKSGGRGCARGNKRGGVGSCEVRIGAWDEAGSLTRAEMRRRLSPSSSANTPPSELPVWLRHGMRPRAAALRLRVVLRTRMRLRPRSQTDVGCETDSSTRRRLALALCLSVSGAVRTASQRQGPLYGECMSAAV